MISVTAELEGDTKGDLWTTYEQDSCSLSTTFLVVERFVRHGRSTWIASNSSEALYLKYLSMTLKVITIRSVARYDWVGLHKSLTR